MCDIEFYHTDGMKIKIVDIPQVDELDESAAFELQWKISAWVDIINLLSHPAPTYSYQALNDSADKCVGLPSALGCHSAYLF
ncbi:DUF2535 family protein [Camelliibacillus cellulosilyticus]|uniref:DUF2535 family protein n=1 Tax=Camelliibacillus cellulosilyticus TaxID=2174486 RepID=A0ABV9GRY2_9BACL